MTPLSRALRRLAHAQPSPVAPSPAELGEAVVLECVAGAYEAVSHEATPPAQVEPSLAPVRLLPPASTPLAELLTERQERGAVRLFCDLAGDSRLAFLTAAQTCGLIVHLDTSGESDAFNSQDETGVDFDLRWPVATPPELLPAAEGVTRVRLRLGNDGIAARDWILFLDDCRDAYHATGLIVPAAARRVLDWLAERSDDVSLVAHSGATHAASARRAASHLRQSASASPICLLVRAA